MNMNLKIIKHMKTNHLELFSKDELPKSSFMIVQGGNGTVTVLDTDMESIVKQY